MSLDAAELAAEVEAVMAAVEGFLEDGVGSLSDRLRLYATLDSLAGNAGRANLARQELEAAIAPDLAAEDEPVEVDGTLWRAIRRRSIRGWQRDELRSAVNRVVMEPNVNPETGEVLAPDTPEVVDRMWRYVDVATGRTGKLRDAGIDPDEYATVRWSDGVGRVE